MFEIPGSRKGYYQWDLNQRLYIQDGGCNEVHFCSEKHPEALTCPVQEELGKRYVQVPNILLQACLPIAAFFYVKGTNGAYTKEAICIEVWERPKPDDYVYTETEVKTWESAVEYALQEAMESGAFKGERGEKGDKGDTGEQGLQGEKGDKGDGVLTEEEKLEFLICCCEEGARINLRDAAQRSLVGLRMFGKTVQDGIPAPNAPIELVSIGDGGNITIGIVDGGQGQTAIVPTPGGLPGIPVSADGNYTDANGQQWICNEIEYSKGVCIQRAYMWSATSDTRIAIIDVLGNCCRIGIPLDDKKASGGRAALCTHTTMRYEYSTDNPHFYCDTDYLWLFLPVNCGTTKEEVKTWLLENKLAVLYMLSTPIETPLSEEEPAALHTYMPNTTIENNSGAWMKVCYVADTKTYIDNKFAELAAAIVNNT